MTGPTNAAMRAPLARLRALASKAIGAAAAIFGLMSVGPIVLAMFVVVTSALGLAVAAAPAASAASDLCGPPVIGQARVVVVVDNGEGGAERALATCVMVPQGAKGAQVLAARAARLGTAAPSHAGSGLLCTIDSFPASQCAETGSGSYWANYSGTGGSWNYSSYNPFIRRVCDGDVEGWRYVVRGSGAAGDAQPRLDAAAVRPSDAWGCTEPTPSPAGSGAAGEPGSTTGAAVAVTADPVATVEGSAEHAADPAATEAAGAGSAPAGTTRSAGDARIATSADAAPATGGATNSAGTTSWLGAGLAIVVIVTLGAAALLRSRRRA
ncbi:MAG: hypothetical protein F2520_06370 [Actinobacteria bacterium]|uniref:Unannotated protein n=1 Tax=freshwater metagenome TaxID=449393 RepID=A0A6J5YFR3_9ZZZZ|nr:hypothetical protein [Actinomycetota bacterium]MTA77867.1 hypothetical protein [Actinomycetota bacterium]